MTNTYKMALYKMVMIMLVFVVVITVQNVGVLQVYNNVGDDTAETRITVLEKFRVLLGLATIDKKREANNGVWESGSPAPAPSPAESRRRGVPSPAPSPAVHLHKHHRPSRPRPMLPVHKFPVEHKENRKKKTVIIAVLLSTGVVILGIFALAAILLHSRRFNRRKKVATRTASVRSDECGDRGTSKSLTAQALVSHNTLTEDGCGVENMQGDVREISLAEEIISVHEYAESSKNDSDDQRSSVGEINGGTDPNMSEDESFHSFCDSRSSSNLRLSNVSVSSSSDPVEIVSPNQSNRSTTSFHIQPSIPTHFDQTNQTEDADSIKDAPLGTCDNTQASQPPPTPPLPPPPPPPPPPIKRVSPSHPSSSSSSTKVSQTLEILHNSSRDLEPSPASNPTVKDGDQTTIPPPPCPPPYPNKGKSVSGPPPPPGQPPAFTPVGKDGNPLPKLKPLHWDKVRATPDRSMVWDKLRCSSFELDEDTIESLFGYSLKTALTNDEGKSKSPSPSKHVLEPKRLQNITILSKALNVTAEKVCEALLQGDGLSTQQLEALIKMEPTKEEEGKLSNYGGEIDELGSAEKLVKELLKIPYAFERVETMLYKATFDDEVVHLRNSFSMLEEACKELRSSRLFLKLLEAVLKTGNRMNVGTIRGGAKAFKLDALLKLADVKGTDGKTTLLHFVVQEIIRSEGIRMSDSIMGKIDRSSKSGTVEEKEDDYRRMGLELVSGLSTELHNVKRTASLDLDVLATSVSNLSDGMFKLQQLINKELHSTDDNFVHVMKVFLSHAENKLKELQNAENMVLLCVRQITEYYHGDVGKEEVNPLRIFVVVRDFLGMLDQVCRELKTLKTPRSPNPLAPFR